MHNNYIADYLIITKKILIKYTKNIKQEKHS